MPRLLYSAALLGIFCNLAIPGAPARSQEITITITKSDQGKINQPPFAGNRAAVDVAILLDTSNSMDGLIAQAKSQLWNIVQQFAAAKKEGKAPILRVAVFEYGNTNLPASEGYIRQVAALTDDMDKISEALFDLTTRGGDEYCGMVIAEAIKRLDWSGEPNSYKAIFIAGNEPFTQGEVDYRAACKESIENGIVVNTIHCGDREIGIRTKWKDGADRAEGSYLNIDQDREVVHIDCPQDEIIIRLNRELNDTYLWFGDRDLRLSYSTNQIAQDKNALRASGSGGFGGGRGIAKATDAYRNVGRDLVDTFAENQQILSDLKPEDLPDSMQAMSPAQRIAHVKQMAQKRAEIKTKIKELSRQRAAFAADRRRELAADTGAATLGDAISSAVREQLRSSGFELQQ